MPLNLNAERWQRLDSLFQLAIELPDADREPFIQRETAGDAELAGELRAMLAHDSAAAACIAGAVEEVARGAAAQYEWIGRRVGPYRIVREIGRGGMGIVFEAVRDGAEFQKTVALKVTPDWRDDGHTRGRFRNECRFLAALEHPNIARFLDGGSEGGVPYLAMEYVEGRPITDWCRERNLGLRERIVLFRRVCAAVDYAHENMIVHRDLKPSNILVDRNCDPKLLDFGIAKLLGPLAEDETATTGARLWTPDYTSPEQMRGGAITARTDVYSLGLILYELLSGARAQTADASSPLTLDRSICESEPPPASLHDRRLRGDLETIIATAIRKEPARRYNSAAALSDDLGRYLEGKPVEARPSTAAYRLGKFVRRHRVGVAAGVLLAASVAGGVAATIYEARRAERRFQQVRSLANAFVFDVHDRIQYLPGSTEARRAIVATGLRYLESLRQEAGADVPLRIELAAAYEKIGDVQGRPGQGNLGDSRGALGSYRHAEELLAPLHARGDARSNLPLASVVYRIGEVRGYRGEGPGAIGDFDRAHRLIRNANDMPSLRLAIDINTETARISHSMANPQRALAAAQESMRIAQRMVALDSGSLETRDYLSQAQSALGTAYRLTNDLEAAARSYRAAVEIREQLVREQPGSAGYRRNLMVGYGHLADTLGLPRLGGIGDMPAAAGALRKAAEIARWLRSTDPADRTARFDMANAQYRLGSVLLAEDGRTAEALAELEQAQALLAGLQQEDPANVRYHFTSMYVLRKVGEALAALGRSAEATRRFNEVRALAATFKGTHSETEAQNGRIAATVELAKVRAKSGDRSAVALAEESVAYLNTAPPTPNSAWGRAVSYADLAGVFRKMGQESRAAACLERSAQMWRALKVPAALEGQRAKELAAVVDAAGSLRASAAAAQ